MDAPVNNFINEPYRRVLADREQHRQGTMTVKTVFVSVLMEDRSVEFASSFGQPLLEWASPRARAGHLAHSLLLRMVSSLWPIEVSRTQIDTEPSGRPYLAGTGLPAVPFISVSHSRGWVACAATEIGPLGVDIELPRPGRNTDQIAAAAFGPLEIQRIQRTGERGFYRIWTVREAIAKATGEGLRLATDRRDRAHQGPEEGNWKLLSGAAPWAISHQVLDTSLHLATAVKLQAETEQVEIRRWPLEDSV